VSVDVIHEAVRSGRMSPEQGARMLELRYELVAIARRRRFRAWLVDALTLGQLRRWMRREWP
jgi:hypothetical protein